MRLAAIVFEGIGHDNRRVIFIVFGQFRLFDGYLEIPQISLLGLLQGGGGFGLARLTGIRPMF